VKILRLGISDDTYGGLPKEARSWHVTATKLAEVTGQPWETALEQAWPYSAWAETVERRIEEENPDLMLLCCASYWVSYPSAPLMVHRSRLPMAKTLARAGFWAASKPLIADRQLFHLGRRALIREANIAFFFDPAKALKSVEAVVRTVLRHEQIALAVRGPLPLNIAGPGSLRELCESRRAAFDAGLAELCRGLHVEYIGFNATDTHPADELLGDRVHVNAKGHTRRAEDEFDVMLRAWRAHTAASRD
jgi:hypothetical protein